MKPTIRLVTFLLSALGGIALSACGGSASETPWPVEPENIDLGPSGETRRDETLTKKPDNQTEAPVETNPTKPKKADPVAP